MLEALSKRFVDTGFDLKELIRTICRSNTYQLSSTPNGYNAKDTLSYSRFYPRRMPAEVMLDSMDALLATSTRFSGLPEGVAAVQLPDHGRVNNFFLNTFGRPAGASACECERSGNVSMAQSLHMLNSSDMYGKLSASRAGTLVSDNERADQDKITELYYRAFSRPPTADELAAFLEHIGKFEDNRKREAYEDILWALVNTKEFMFNH